jgi:hypothetical protein
MTSEQRIDENEKLGSDTEVEIEDPTCETDGYNLKLYSETQKTEKTKEAINELKNKQKENRNLYQSLEDKTLVDLRDECKRNKITYRGNKSALVTRLKEHYNNECGMINKKIKDLQPKKKPKKTKKRGSGITSRWATINLEHQDLRIRDYKNPKERKEQEKRSKAKYNDIMKKALNRYVKRDDNVDEKELEEKGEKLDSIRDKMRMFIISFEDTNDEGEEHHHFHLYYSMCGKISDTFIEQERNYWDKELSFIDPETGERKDQMSNLIRKGKDNAEGWKQYICKDFRKIGEDSLKNDVMSVQGFKKVKGEIKNISNEDLNALGDVYNQKNARKNVRATTGLRNTPKTQEQNNISDTLEKIMKKNKIKVEFYSRQLVRFEKSLEKWGYEEVSKKEFREICDDYFTEINEQETGNREKMHMEKVIGLTGIKIMDELISLPYSDSLPCYKPDERYIGFLNCKFNVMTGLPEPYRDTMEDDEIHCKHYSRYNYKHHRDENKRILDVPQEYIDILLLQDQRDPINHPLVNRWFNELRDITQPESSHKEHYPGVFLYGHSRTGKNSVLLPVHHVDKIFFKNMEVGKGSNFSFASIRGYHKVRIEEGDIMSTSGVFMNISKQLLEGNSAAVEVKGSDQAMVQAPVFTQISNEPLPEELRPHFNLECPDEHRVAVSKRIKANTYNFLRRVDDPVISNEKAEDFKFMLLEYAANIIAFACIDQSEYWDKLEYTDEQLGIPVEDNVYLTRADVRGRKKVLDYKI